MCSLENDPRACTSEEDVGYLKRGGGHLGGALVVEEGVEPDAGLEARGAAAEHALEGGDELAERRGQPPARFARKASKEGMARCGRR